MKPYKAFISHRGSQKDSFVNPMLEYLNRNFAVVDLFDFNNGDPTDEAIKEHMKDCSIFVAIITDDYPDDSRATKLEIKLAKKAFEQGEMRIIPIIASERITYKNLPPRLRWMGKALTMRQILSPRIAAAKINSALASQSRLLSEHDANLCEMYIGRDRETGEIRRQVIHDRNCHVLLASGHKGVGRKSFLRHCVQDLRVDKRLGDSIPVKLGEQADIRDLALELNDVMGNRRVTRDAIVAMTDTQVTDLVVDYVSFLEACQCSIMLKDRGAVVTDKGRLAHWMINLLDHPSFPASIRLLIASDLKLRDSGARHIAACHLNALTQDDREQIIRQACRRECTETELEEITDADYRTLATELKGSVRQIELAVNDICRHGIRYALSHLAEIKAKADGYLASIINSVIGSPLHTEVLGILANVDFISIKLLHETFDAPDERDAIDGIIDDFNIHGVIDFHGAGYDYISIDYVLNDYIQRSKIGASSRKRMTKLAKLVARQVESEADRHTYDGDLSQWRIKLATELKRGENNPTAMLLPSLVLNTMERLYRNKSYSQMIKLGERALENTQNYTTDNLHYIRYRLCLGYARLARRRTEKAAGDAQSCADNFFRHLANIEVKKDYKFLLGFYYRVTRNRSKYAEGLQCLQYALKIDDNMRIARRELVNIYFNMGDFTSAYDPAERNYNDDPGNAYHIRAYFRALLHKPRTPERHSLLSRLIEEMRGNVFRRASEFLCTMELELAQYEGIDITDRLRLARAKWPDWVSLDEVQSGRQ